MSRTSKASPPHTAPKRLRTAGKKSGESPVPVRDAEHPAVRATSLAPIPDKKNKPPRKKIQRSQTSKHRTESGINKPARGQILRKLADTALRQARELTLLELARNAIISNLDMPTLLRSVVESIADVYGYTHVSIYLLEGEELVLQHQVGYQNTIERIGIHEGVSGRVVRTAQPVLIENVTDHSDFLAAVKNIVSEITVPLLGGDLPLGTLTVESTTPLAEADLKILVALGADVSLAVVRARLYQDLQQQNRTLTALQEATLAVISQIGLSDALQAILKQAAELSGTEHAYIDLVQPEGRLQVVTGIGIYPKYVGIQIQPGEGLAGRVWQSARPLIVNDYPNWEGRSPQFADSPFYAVIGIPLMRGSRIDGVLGLAHLTPGRTFSARDADLLNRFAQLASIALENARLYEDLKNKLAERKLADNLVRSSEERLQAVMEGSQLGYSDWNMKTGNIQRNERWAGMLGYTLAEIDSSLIQWEELLHPEDRERALSAVKDHLEGRTPIHRDEYRLRAKDGSYRWILDQGRIIEYDDEGHPLRMTATHTDITEKKLAEEALQKTQQRLRVFFNQSLDGFFFCDFEEPIEWKRAADKEATLEYIIAGKRFTEANEAMLKQYGLSREAFLKLTTKDVFAHDLEQGRKLRRKLFDRGSLHLETYERTSEGRPVWFEGDYVCLYDESERITGFFGIQREITDRKNAEQALRESEERYRTLVTGMLDGVYRSTHNGKFVDVNPAMVRMFGYDSREEMLALDIKRDLYFSPEERQSLFLDTGQEKVDVFRMKRKDGSEIWVEDHGHYVHDEQGNVLYHEGILRDVTERKRAEEALLTSEKTFRGLFNSVAEAIYIQDTEGRFLDVNEGVPKMYGYPKEFFIGNTPEPLSAPGRNDLKKVARAVEATFKGKPQQFEFWGIRSNGEVFPKEVRLYKGTYFGKDVVIALAQDITERKKVEEAIKEAEEKYRSIFENAVEGIYQSTPEGRFRTVNPAFADMLGYASPQEMVASITNIADQIYHDPARRADFMRILSQQGNVSGFEYQMRRRDGGLVWVSENARMARDADGGRLYYEGLLEDITVRKENEQRIQTQLDQLNSLHVIENAINTNSDLRMTFEIILREVVAQLGADAACVLLLNKDTRTLDFSAGRGFFSKAIQHTKLSVGEGYAGRVIRDRKTLHIPDLSRDENNRLLGALKLAGENFTAYVGCPLIAKGQAVGVLEIFQRASLDPTPDWFDFLSMLADQAALAIDNTQLFETLQRTNFDLTLAYDATIEGWSRAMDLRDRETEGHTRRVTDLTIRLARSMGISDADILHIRRGALLHDIGKMGIPDNILHKPTDLTPEEWEIMRQHTEYARQMLTPIHYLKPALDIPCHHHEKWNGTGYPKGLKGEQIPIAARIFAVVDVWDALTSDRSYREAWAKETALEYIRSESGRHFDPAVVETFLSLLMDE